MENGQGLSSGGMPPVQPAQPMQPGGQFGSGIASGGMSGDPGAPVGSATPGAEFGIPSAPGVPGANPGMPGAGIPNAMGGAPGGAPAVAPNGMPMVQQVQVTSPQKKDIAGLVKTIVIIVVSLIAVTFIGLFIWMTVQYNEANDDVQGKIDEAVIIAKDEEATKQQAKFLEEEKYPYKTFAGPIDYGQLTFEYPKTWSVYVAAAATEGGNFNAYLNPIQVDAVGKDTINALRVTILNESFDKVTEDYQKEMEKKKTNLTVESVTIGAKENITANRYTGTIPDTDLSGFIVTFKIRDKTAIMQTDSVLFQGEFDKLLGTVTFNE